jgi:hypothetical protein
VALRKKQEPQQEDAPVALRQRPNRHKQPLEAPKTGLRARASQRIMKVGFFRRRYIKRLLKYLDKSKAKGRPIPAELEQLSEFLDKVPKPMREKRLEEAILAQQEGGEAYNRELRRAAANQQRRSGKGAGGYRPGAPPRSLQQGPRPSRKPR